MFIASVFRVLWFVFLILFGFWFSVSGFIVNCFYRVLFFWFIYYCFYCFFWLLVFLLIVFLPVLFIYYCIAFCFLFPAPIPRPSSIYYCLLFLLFSPFGFPSRTLSLLPPPDNCIFIYHFVSSLTNRAWPDAVRFFGFVFYYYSHPPLLVPADAWKKLIPSRSHFVPHHFDSFISSR